MLASSSLNVLKRRHAKNLVMLSEMNTVGAANVSCRLRRYLSVEAVIDNSRPQRVLFGHSNNLFRGPSSPPLAKVNLALQSFLDRQQNIKVFAAAKHMKGEQLTPDRTTYNCLLEACAQQGLHLEARAVFDDMVAMGIHPDRRSFHHLMRSIPNVDQNHLGDLLKMMEEWSIQPNEYTYEIVITRLTANQRLELALQYLSKFSAADLSPTLPTAAAVITCAAELGFCRLALDLANAFEHTSVRRLDDNVWVDLLISSAENLYAEGTLETWKKVVTDSRILPDEGCCIQVLHTAARHGLSGLALEVIETLKTINIVWCEHHMAPVMEAMCHHNETKEALMMLAFLRKNDIAMTLETAKPILDLISKDLDAVDDAWGKLEDIREEGHEVDVVALNVVIQAAVALKDLQRAIGSYKAAPQLEVKPDIDTFNVLLLGCIDARHRDLGDRLLVEMKELGIRPDTTTYERMVRLCLAQSTYEDAFFYLEEMKTFGMVPPIAVYESIIRKLVTVGDTRFNLALEELKECGYEISAALQSFISSGGAHNGPKKTAPLPEATVVL